MAFIFHHHEDGHFPPSSSSCAPQDIHDHVSGLSMRRSASYTGLGRAEEIRPEDDMSDDDDEDSCRGGGNYNNNNNNKKRRLSLEQVKALENSFESGNKLEPERKIQLARALGLQPRQVAIWFQNRRARWKTKQLERDYGVLKTQFESLKARNHALTSLNNKLHSQLMLAMKDRESSGLETLNDKINDEDIMKNNVVALSSSVDPPGASSSKQADNLIQDQRVNDNINDPLIHNHMFSCVDENNYPDFWAWHGHQNFQ